MCFTLSFAFTTYFRFIRRAPGGVFSQGKRQDADSSARARTRYLFAERIYPSYTRWRSRAIEGTGMICRGTPPALPRQPDVIDNGVYN